MLKIMKFSIVVPVYNVEKYIDTCLKSIYEQSYTNYEVIIVNDGSLDNSQKIIDEYTKKDNRFKSYIKENGGLSDARNFGIQHITGDYLLFVDSDDYIEKDLLLKLNECAQKNEIVRFNINIVNEHGDIIGKSKSLKKSGNTSFKDLILDTDYFEPAWSYAYSVTFWNENNFTYPVGKIHEDFGLIPLCVILAKHIYYLDYYGYNYVQREGSITKGSTKALKRVNDNLYHFDNLTKRLEDVEADETNKNLLKSYLANVLISCSQLLEEKDLQNFIHDLKIRKIYKYVLADSFPRKLKKMLIKWNIKLYINSRYRKNNT